MRASPPQSASLRFARATAAAPSTAAAAGDAIIGAGGSIGGGTGGCTGGGAGGTGGGTGGGIGGGTGGIRCTLSPMSNKILRARSRLPLHASRTCQAVSGGKSISMSRESPSSNEPSYKSPSSANIIVMVGTKFSSTSVSVNGLLILAPLPFSSEMMHNQKSDDQIATGAGTNFCCENSKTKGYPPAAGLRWRRETRTRTPLARLPRCKNLLTPFMGAHEGGLRSIRAAAARFPGVLPAADTAARAQCEL